MKNFFSYLLPMRVKTYPSKYSGILEVNLINGRRVLDTRNSNYSYGQLQKILSKGLHAIDASALNFQSILVLGMGGGSVVETIRTEFSCDAPIDLVDFDEAIIALARNEFNINRWQPITIIHADANEYVFVSSKKYDLIIIDLFIIDTVPMVFTEVKFITQVVSLLTAQGKIIFNSMNATMPAERFKSIQTHLAAAGMKIQIIENIFYTNNLIIASR